MTEERAHRPRGPADATVIPRFAGPATFARLPTIDQVPDWDIALVGVPFDGGTSYRPGARFGPGAVRQGSRLLRPYHPELDTLPFALGQVVDAGDISCSPFDIAVAVHQIEEAAGRLLAQGGRMVAVGGDHTIALPLLRASRELLALLRGLDGLAIVGADVVEVAPAYDHAEITAIAAADVLYDLVTLMAWTLGS